jgi:ABC-type uncharacterized transport system involved in gliding motility auxiliary subunit
MATNNAGNRQFGSAMGTLGLVAFIATLYAKIFIIPEFTNPAILVMAAITVVALAIYFATNFRSLGDKFGGRGALFLTTTAISAALLAGALGAANYIAVKKPKTWDLTKDQIFTLSDQTTGVLKGLTTEVTVTAFYGTGEPEWGELDNRLKQYKEVTDKLKVELLDPQKHLAEVKQFNIAQTGPRIIVKAGNKEARAKELTEESLTNAISEVTRGGAKKIYFSRGHGERAIGDATERGMKLFVDALKSEGFQVDELSLAENKEMPADAQALVIAGPVSSLLEGEAKLVGSWVDSKNGKLVLLSDPGVANGLEAQLAAWGVKLGNDVVLDPESQQPDVAIAQSYAEHPITAPRSSPFQLATIFPLARSVQKLTAPAGWTQTELAKTGGRAWGETSSLAGGTAQFDPGQDLKGPVTLAMALQKGAGEADSRVVLVGNSAFVANGYLRLSGNRDFALNTISWTAHDESKISIRPKTRSANHLFLTAEQKNFMRLFAGVVLPFSLLFAGLLVWQTRRAR